MPQQFDTLVFSEPLPCLWPVGHWEGARQPVHEIKLVPLAGGRLAVRHDAHPFLQ